MNEISLKIRDHVLAGFSGLYILSHELETLEESIRGLCSKYDWIFSRWDRGRGLIVGETLVPESSYPMSAISTPQNSEGKSSILFLHNYYRYFKDNAQIVQTLRNLLISGKAVSHTVIIASPVLQLPPELERLFTVLDHPLPTHEELQDVLGSIEADGGCPELEGDPISAAKGLTRIEAEDAFSLSLVQSKKVKEDEVRKIKVQAIKKSGYLDLYEGKEDFSKIGGLDALKHFCSKLLRKDNPILAKGILLVGVPGAGKSASIKALGNEIGRPVLQLDMGRMHSKYVGDSEANLRSSLKLAEAMSPSILMIDEVEKGLSGVDSEGDSGVSARLFGHLLTWLSDHTSPVFVAMTSNNIQRLPPEFSRAERLDGIFFVDLPSRKEKTLIWNMYLKEFSREGQELPDDSGFTGAEIKSCCRLSVGLDVTLEEAATFVIPVTKSAPNKIVALREWANDRVLSASTPGLYKTPQASSGRKVSTQ